MVTGQADSVADEVDHEDEVRRVALETIARVTQSPEEAAAHAEAMRRRHVEAVVARALAPVVEKRAPEMIRYTDVAVRDAPVPQQRSSAEVAAAKKLADHGADICRDVEGLIKAGKPAAARRRIVREMLVLHLVHREAIAALRQRIDALEEHATRP